MRPFECCCAPPLFASLLSVTYPSLIFSRVIFFARRYERIDGESTSEEHRVVCAAVLSLECISFTLIFSFLSFSPSAVGALNSATH